MILSIVTVACSNNKAKESVSTSFTALEKAIIKTNDATGMEGHSAMDMTMNVMGQEMETSSSMNFIFNDIKGKQPKEGKIEVTVSTMGEEQQGTYYLKDNALYMEIQGQKIKDTALDQFDQVAKQAAIPVLNQSSISTIKEEKKDDNIVYAIELNEAERNRIAFEKIGNDFRGLGIVEEDISFNNYKLSYTVNKEGYVVQRTR